MTISKEDVQTYIQENFDTFFVSALAKYVKDVLFQDTDDEELIQDYRQELKDLIFDGAAYAVKEYLEHPETEGEIIKCLSKHFMESFSEKEISIHFK